VLLNNTGDVISGDATSGDVTILTNPPQMLTELCPYTTSAYVLVLLTHNIIKYYTIIKQDLTCTTEPYYLARA
jgi:hypothetical protein